ncbi:MAG: hypothetical protein WCR49_03270, partial [Opitutae bacterium]
DRPLDGGSALLSVYLPPLPGPKKGVSSTEMPQRLLQVEQNGRRIVSTPTYFPLNEASTCWAMDGRSWQAKDQPAEVSVHVPTGELPGRIVFRFELPEGGFTGSEPLLSAGLPGAADSLYLRSIGEGRYIVGLDHWGYGALESGPVALPATEVHKLSIELGSLFPPGQVAADLIRVKLNDTIVLESHLKLYEVKPGQVVVGRNPLGMSTSGPSFRGVIYSVHTNQPPGK